MKCHTYSPTVHTHPGTPPFSIFISFFEPRPDKLSARSDNTTFGLQPSFLAVFALCPVCFACVIAFALLHCFHFPFLASPTVTMNFATAVTKLFADGDVSQSLLTELGLPVESFPAAATWNQFNAHLNAEKVALRKHTAAAAQ
jgi:hypothetical protein